MKVKLKKVIITIFIFIIIFSTVSITLLHFTHEQYFTRYDYKEKSAFFRYEDIKDKYSREIVSFYSGENKLVGYVYGNNNSKGLVVLSHGLEGGADDYLDLIMYFVDKDWRVFAFDNTGSYGSEGESVVSHVQSTLDLNNALTYIKSNDSYKDLPIMLIGHSWGGYAVGAVLNYDHDIKAVVSASGYDTPLQQMYYQMKLRVGSFAYVEYPYLWLYMHTRFGKLAELSAIEGINKSNANVLVLQGSNDPFYGNVSSIYANQYKITSTDCTLYLLDEEPNNGHRNYFYSKEAVDYQNELLSSIKDDNELYTIVDKYKWNKPNEDLLKLINNFFEKSLEK